MAATTTATLHYTRLRYTTLHYTTLQYTTLHYTTLLYTTLHHTTTTTATRTATTTATTHTLITLHYNYKSTTLHDNYNYNCATPHCIKQLWVSDHCNHCSYFKKHNSHHLSVHQWIRSAIRDSQQPPSPTGFLFLKLPPPPCAVLLVSKLMFMEESLEVKLPTIWTDERQSREEAERRERLEERRVEEKE